MALLQGILIGLGLGAASGFRVSIPLLVVSLASRAGHLPLRQDFGWIASRQALLAFSIAALLEIAGAYIPWVGAPLDAIATPAAVVAGFVLAASTLAGLGPFLRFPLAVLLGGGLAAVFQGVIAAARQLPRWSTGGGFAHPALSTAETIGAALLATLAVTLPILALVAVLGLLYLAVRQLLLPQRRQPREPMPQPT